MELWTLLGDIVVLLGASLIMGGVFSRFGQSPIVGYLFAGMALGGAGSLNLIGSEHEIEAIAELGVALLLFSLGLEFSVERLKKLGAKPLLGGAVQVGLTILLASLAASAFGIGFKESVAFGAMVSLSSTAIVLRILLERGELEMPHGRNSLGVLLTQDIAVVPLALLMPVLGGEGTASEIALDIGKLLLMAFGLVVALYVLGKIAVLALGALTLHRNRELAMIFAIVAGLGSAWAAHFVGISPALGAFVAGMLLGSSAFATQIRADVAPMQVILLTLFFGAAGMVADPIWILQNWYFVAAVVMALTLGKLIVIWAIFKVLGQTHRVASATGLSLAQVGEFAFVLGSIGKVSGVVSNTVYGLVVSVTIVSFFASAFLIPAAPKFGNWIARLFKSKDTFTQTEDGQEDSPAVAIIGFGPAGQLVAQPLIDKGVRVLVVDLNQDNVNKARQLGFKAELGDATQSEVLEHARLTGCKAVVITVPHFDSAMSILNHIRRHAPHIHVVVRSRYERHFKDFISAGAHVVRGDEHQVGQSLSRYLCVWIEVPIKEEELGGEQTL